MPSSNPSIVLIGGPNGAGKTTISRAVISETLGIAEFVNADVIAQGLSGFAPERAALAAGRIMLTRLKELAAARTSFAFESTLASRTLAPWFASLIESGYELLLIYVWLRSPDVAMHRVCRRVSEGGHSVPPDVIRRRYFRSVANFVHLYLPLATRWQVYDNSTVGSPELIASRRAGESPLIVNVRTWNRILRIADAQSKETDR
ncbi:MAG: zeta toxin family protein [Phycisphaeraceae bacterium]|nr:zeta toxin family protein [Phycisphaeraceae bacterium]